MLAHLIHYKGKGIWVLAMPLLIALVLFQLAELFHIDDRYVGGIAFTLSGIVLFLIDNKRKTIIDGTLLQKVIKLPREKRKNTLMWIEVKYWSVFLFVIGVIWILNTK